jgi:hypothetical protein
MATSKQFINESASMGACEPIKTENEAMAQVKVCITTLDKVSDSGVILSPGKFESEMLYVPYLASETTDRLTATR